MCCHGLRSLSCVSPDVGSFYFSPYFVILFFVIPNQLGCHSSKITFVRKNSCSKGKDFSRVKILWLVMVARRIPTRRIRQARFLSALVETFFIIFSSRNLQKKVIFTILVVCYRCGGCRHVVGSFSFHGIAYGGSRGTCYFLFYFPPGDATPILPHDHSGRTTNQSNLKLRSGLPSQRTRRFVLLSPVSAPPSLLFLC